MNQEKVGKFIKELRVKAGLSQEKFGEKYGVTYQAVSKWENGKNLPDISILKEICNDYNVDINELLLDKKRSKKKLIIGLSLCIILGSIIIVFFLINNNHNDSFHFKTIKTACSNFELYGSIAYDDKKTSIYISDITYCGEANDTVYKSINCTLYELGDDTKRKIEEVNYNKDITLDEFLKMVHFNIDHYSEACLMYKDNGMILEIKAIDKDDKTTFYEIPLEYEDNCEAST